jgi:hypothetical protein
MKKISLLLFTLVLAINASAQYNPDKQSILTNTLNVGVQIYNTASMQVFPVITPTGFGSGVYLQKKLHHNDAVATMIFATNAHIVSFLDDAGKRIVHPVVKVRHNRIDAGIIDLDFHVAYIDTTDDIAFLKRSNVGAINFKMLRRMGVDVSNILPEDSIYQGMMMYLLGYPVGVGKGYAKPSIRSGIASYIDTHNHACLVDIDINHGNSGGPVYCVINDQFRLVGLGRGFKSDAIEQRRIPGVSIETNSGLGNVILSFIIQKHLENIDFTE